MGPVVVTMSISLDGYGVGDDLTDENPLGEILLQVLHRWLFEGAEENESEADAILAGGAYIMGRNMFGPIRGEWTGDWKGWWGPNPPWHRQVFVLTNHPRQPIEMEGGTTFTFVTGGIEAALEQARAAAGDLPVHVAGGVSTANQYLASGLVDELRLQIVPALLGGGGRLFEGAPRVDLETLSVRATSMATHVHYRIER